MAFRPTFSKNLPQKAPPSSGTACNVAQLPITGTRIINVATESALQSAVSNAQAGDTIVIANGTYNLTSTLYLNGKNNVTIRGSSGCDGVILVGQGMDNASYGNVQFGIWTNSQNTTVAHLTIRDTWENAVHLTSGAQSPRIYSVKMLDIGSQFVKSNPTDPNAGTGVDNGILEYSWMEYTAGTPSNPAHSGGTGYTQALSAHTADNWIVRNNFIKNLHTPDGSANLWNPAILFWNHSQNAVVENNTIVNADRAIGMGLIDQATETDSSGGTVRNNVVYYAPGLYSASRKASTDGAIIAADSPSSKVYHNTILTNGNYNFSVEFRFSGSSAGEVRNNLTDAPLNLARDGASAVQSGNYLTATQSMFVNPTAAGLHLLSTAAAAINTAPTLASVTTDFDSQSRPQGSGYDIGADEFTSGTTPPPPPPPPPPSSITNLTLTTTLEGRSSANTPFTLQLLDPGTSTVRHTSSYTTNASGNIVISFLALAPGTYDLRLQSQYYLSRKALNQPLNSNTTLTLPMLRAGDLTADNIINSLDWSIMNTSWFSASVVADINRDGLVNSLDFSYLSRNWGRVGE